MSDLGRTSSTKCKKKHFKPKHQKSKLFRANEPLLSVLMWGVNHTINELNHVNIPVMLMPDDFRAFTKVRVNNHLYQKDVMPSHFKVKEYCPLVFRNLRERFSVDDGDYLKSLTKFQPVSAPKLSGRQTKFYTTYDNQLILKTLSSDEVENMHHFLKEYHPYIVERYGKTLLPQYLGMYRLTVEGQVTYVVVMRNIFYSKLPIHKKYDLKGSNPDREASEKERGKELPCFKDSDFIRDGAKLYIDLNINNTLISTLEADTAFLVRENLVDYSLCLGIHDCNKYQQDLAEISSPKSTSSNDDEEDVAGSGSPGKEGDKFEASERMQVDDAPDIGVINSIPAPGGRQIYFMGLVDVLTQFGLRKRIVTIDPEQYRKKFMEFITKAIVTQPST